MQTKVRIPRRLALVTAGIVGLTIAIMVAVTPAKAGSPMSSATISGPATVWDGVTCTWESTTDISEPNYEWSVNGTVVGTYSWLSYAFDRSNGGAHQSLSLRVYNASGDNASTNKLIGVYIYGSGSPDCTGLVP
jgi:hypothetical protein